MNDPSFRAVDRDGFPVASTFDDLIPREEIAVVEHAGHVWWRGGLAIVGIGLLFAAIGQQLWSAGREGIARKMLENGVHDLFAGDADAALADFDRAILLKNDMGISYLLRAKAQVGAGRLEAALADLDRARELNYDTLEVSQNRGIVLLRMGRHREAIDESTSGLARVSEFDQHVLLNSRAYARAIAGIELDEALKDIERAIAYGGEEAAYLDTRGYILHLLGQNDKALADLYRAVEMTVEWNESLLEKARRRRSDLEYRVLAKELDEYLAVLLHHRGLALMAVNRQVEGKDDLRRAVQLGYNPDAGVF